MNGPSTINGPTNEQLIGKFQVINLDKLPVNTLNNHDDAIPQVPMITDELGCPSRFQMIRVDRNFGRGRWKVNDYEPPENISNSLIPLVNTIENESITIPNNNSTFANVPIATIPNISATVPTVVTGDSNVASSATLAATAASAAAAAATAFQQQQQMALKNAPTLVPTANVAPTAGLLHAYPPAPLPNQPYLLPNHPQFGYYPFYPTPYAPYPTSWAAAAAAALAASNPFLQPPTLAPPQPTTSSLPPTANINDPTRLPDAVSDINGENTVMSSANFPNPTTDHLQSAQLAAAVAPFLYAAHPSHAAFVAQASSTTSPYATIPPYHPVPPLPTIIPRNQASQTFPTSHTISNNTNDIQTSHQVPILTSPKHDTTKNLNQQSSSLISTTKPKPLVTTVVNDINNDLSKSTQVTDLISSSPLITTSDLLPPSLISPININVTNPSTTSLTDIWTYTTSGSPLNLTQTAQTAAVTAAAAISLLNNENSQNTEIANEILKELTTPTKQNNFSLLEKRACLSLRGQLSTTDIDNKISAAMDLVKMHLLSAVRDEVTELRQQIRTLNERVNNAEHENAFLRQHVPSEIYAQYIPIFIGLSSSNEPNNSSTTTNASSIPLQPSSQPVLMNSSSSNPSPLVQQPTSLPTNLQQPLANTNLPST